ncbi:MAG: cytochrome b/b6 domain-containing protein [Deltaproteobacteria bacterium]|nr:cytochrome b/b6 domain-containing protein [Deltaproteobacteria bacterium]
MKTQKVLFFSLYERFWHWSQALLIFVLTFTGLEVHGTMSVMGMEKAVNIHNVAGWALVVLEIFTLFWMMTSGQWKQYIPRFEKLVDQVKYYAVGIFQGAPHPTVKTPEAKHNPLQRLTYLGLLAALVPLQLITGALYWGYPQYQLEGFPLETLAVVHTLGAFGFVSFVVVHVYMTTTGHTVFSNLIAMITGYEETEKEVH